MGRGCSLVRSAGDSCEGQPGGMRLEWRGAGGGGAPEGVSGRSRDQMGDGDQVGETRQFRVRSGAEGTLAFGLCSDT